MLRNKKCYRPKSEQKFHNMENNPIENKDDRVKDNSRLEIDYNATKIAEKSTIYSFMPVCILYHYKDLWKEVEISVSIKDIEDLSKIWYILWMPRWRKFSILYTRDCRISSNRNK